MDAQVHIFTAAALLRFRVASAMLGRLYHLGKASGTHFMRVSEPQDQPGHEGVKKNVDPSETQDRTQAIKPLAALATCLYINSPLIFK